MKQLLTYFLIFILFISSLVPKGDVEELGKFPELIEHYQLHKSVESSLTFWDFLNKHYGNKSANNDNHSHDQMPFFQHSLPNVVFTINQITHITLANIVSEVKLDWKVCIASYFYTFSSFLLQPPQVA